MASTVIDEYVLFRQKRGRPGEVDELAFILRRKLSTSDSLRSRYRGTGPIEPELGVAGVGLDNGAPGLAQCVFELVLIAVHLDVALDVTRLGSPADEGSVGSTPVELGFLQGQVRQVSKRIV